MRSHERLFGAFHVFCGMFAGAEGMERAEVSFRGLEGRFETVGGVDSVDSCPQTVAAANAYLGRPVAKVLDLFTRQQYADWHGHEPPAGWREASVGDLRNAATRPPDVLVSSPPCRGFSSLLPPKRAASAKYQALNALAYRGIFLALEAWQDRPPKVVLLENVRGIQTRGARWLEEIEGLLAAYGYSVTSSLHCCGELGPLAQRRQRFLLIGRHVDQLPPLLYQPKTHQRLAVGDVLGGFPVPGDPWAGPLHRPRRTTWRTAVRLALIRAGKDWRDLERLEIKDGVCKDVALAPITSRHNGELHVQPWETPAGTVAGNNTGSSHNVADPRARAFGRAWEVLRWGATSGAITSRVAPSCGAFSVADPRVAAGFGQAYGVAPWSSPSATMTGNTAAGGGSFSIADPRLQWSANSHHNKLRVLDSGRAAGTVIGVLDSGSGAWSIADPRLGRNAFRNMYRVVAADESSQAVTSGHLAVAAPLTGWNWTEKTSFQAAGNFGVLGWSETARAITARGDHSNGWSCLADPRPLPRDRDLGVFVIISEDGTWHRPMTLLERAALQSLISPEDLLPSWLGAERDQPDVCPWSWADGLTDTKIAQLIGNAIPGESARVIAETILYTLLAAEAGETFMLPSSNDPWCREQRLLAAGLALPAEGLE